jgi:NADPH:quinone reductase-like Zn-dependent oxidoreductase
MKAAIHHTHGGLDVLRIEDVPSPRLGATEVLIAIRATALNRLDVLQRQGPPLLPGFSLPHIAGMDVAGEVIAVGPDVNTVAVGQRVVVNPALECETCSWCLRGEDRYCPSTRVVGGNWPGGYAEACAVPATHVYPIPDGVGFAEAAAVPTTWSTAWKGLVDTGRIQVGETVVIHAAGSGVSVAAIQIAKRAGATVVATAGSAEKLQRAAKLGADVTVNNRTEDVTAAVRQATDGVGADMVFDHVGPALFQQSVVSLRPRGRLVFCGTTTGTEATFNLPFAYHFGISLIGVEPYSHAEFRQMLEFYWKGNFDPVIDSEMSLDEAVAAQRRMEAGDLFGKIILRP